MRCTATSPSPTPFSPPAISEIPRPYREPRKTALSTPGFHARPQHRFLGIAAHIYILTVHHSARRQALACCPACAASIRRRKRRRAPRAGCCSSPWLRRRCRSPPWTTGATTASAVETPAVKPAPTDAAQEDTEEAGGDRADRDAHPLQKSVSMGRPTADGCRRACPAQEGPRLLHLQRTRRSTQRSQPALRHRPTRRTWRADGVVERPAPQGPRLGIGDLSWRSGAASTTRLAPGGVDVDTAFLAGTGSRRGDQELRPEMTQEIVDWWLAHCDVSTSSTARISDHRQRAGHGLPNRRPPASGSV